MSSTTQLARIAGVSYLLVGIFGGFAEGFVDPKLHVAGNAAATAGNVVANAELVRMGVVAHLADGAFSDALSVRCARPGDARSIGCEECFGRSKVCLESARGSDA